MPALATCVNPDVSALPRLVVGIDPDSRSTALAWAVRRDDGAYVFAGCEGGGTRRVSWSSITGALAWLREQRATLGIAEPGDVAVAVESQAPTGPQSKDCEPLRRVRYHWDAACEIEGHTCEHVAEVVWTGSFLRGEPIGRGTGARKVAYQRRAKALTSLATNEDRCAAIGILYWYVVGVLGSSLVFDQ